MTCPISEKRKFDLFHPRTLRHKMVIFLLVPLTLLLFGSGLLAFIYAREAYLSQWRETALLKLERAAHYIDMRLEKPVELIEMFGSIGRSGDPLIAAQILEKIRSLPGVTDVVLEGHSGDLGVQDARRGRHMMKARMMPFHAIRLSTITRPQYDPAAGSPTVQLVSHLLDPNGKPVGRLVIQMHSAYLMQGIHRLGWQQSDSAALMDENGRYLLNISGGDHIAGPGEALRTDSAKILSALDADDSGTLLGPGHPPETVIGYHRLTEAPWSLVLEARGEKILAPIIKLRFLFFTGVTVLLLFLFLLIRTSIGRVVKTICILSSAAQQVARGSYGHPIPVQSSDEIGHLTQSYNCMVEGLKQRDLIRDTFGRYIDEDVARDLLDRPNAVRLGGDRREVAILMSDIRGFTPLSENLSPESAIQMLNAYFGHMIEVVKAHRGILVDFVGDALLAFFDPLDGPIEAAALRSLHCARDMQARMTAVNLAMEKAGLAPVAIGIGIHVGAVVVGNIGSEARSKYGIVGASVNLTQRIEGKADAGQTVLSGECYRLVSDHVVSAAPVREHLKGVMHPIELHLVRRWRTTPPAGHRGVEPGTGYAASSGSKCPVHQETKAEDGAGWTPDGPSGRQHADHPRFE